MRRARVWPCDLEIPKLVLPVQRRLCAHIVATCRVVLDPILAFGIGLWLIYSSYSLGKEAIMILMELAPLHIDVVNLSDEIRSVSGVQTFLLSFFHPPRCIDWCTFESGGCSDGPACLECITRDTHRHLQGDTSNAIV